VIVITSTGSPDRFIITCRSSVFQNNLLDYFYMPSEERAFITLASMLVKSSSVHSLATTYIPFSSPTTIVPSGPAPIAPKPSQ
jgi:hypothetical protein